MHLPLYPALTRRLLAGALDLLVCAWFFVLAIALVHLSTAPVTLYTEDLLMRAAALSAVMFLVYFFVTESSPAQASVGKRLLGMKVMDAQGRAPGFESHALRFGLTLVGLATAGLGFLPALRSRQGRCLQDRFSGTLVVMRDALPGQLRVHERQPLQLDDRLSFAACAALALVATQVAWPWWQQQIVAMRIDRSVQASRTVSEAIARHAVLHGRSADDLRSLGVSLLLEDGDAQVESLRDDGSFDLRLNMAPVQGLRLRLAPTATEGSGEGVSDGAERGHHRCRSVDVPARYLPGRCEPSADAL